MNYKEALKLSMENLAKDSKVRFIGYNILYGSKAYGTLACVPESSCVETPLAENLMAGIATGMSLEGYKPVLFFERHDFILNALDAIVNHLDKIEKMSYGAFRTPVIIRAAVGSKSPLDPGAQHKQDFSSILKKIVSFPVYDLGSPAEILRIYKKAAEFKQSMLLIERRDLYNKS